MLRFICYIDKLTITLSDTFFIKFGLNDDEQLLYLGSLFRGYWGSEKQRRSCLIFTHKGGAINYSP